MNPRCKRINKSINETILIESNFDMSKITKRKAIKWNEIEFPENWVIEGAVSPQPITQHNLTNIIQTLDGNIKIEFEKPTEIEEISNTSLIKKCPSTKSNYSYIL